MGNELNTSVISSFVTNSGLMASDILPRERCYGCCSQLHTVALRRCTLVQKNCFNCLASPLSCHLFQRDLHIAPELQPLWQQDAATTASVLCH